MYFPPLSEYGSLWFATLLITFYLVGHTLPSTRFFPLTVLIRVSETTGSIKSLT